MAQSELLIDVSRLMWRAGQGRLPTGVDRVCLEYVRRFGSRATASIQRAGWRRILPFGAAQDLFGLLLDPPHDYPWQAGKLMARACMPPWPSQDSAGRLAFHLGQVGLDKPGFGHWLAKTRQRPIMMVHDLIPLTHPEYCRPGESERHASRMNAVLRSAAGILAISQDTMDRLSRFAAHQGLPMPAAAVAPLAPASLPLGLDTVPPMDVPYFVVLGTIEPRKNHLMLLQVWRELAERLGSATPHLVLIGQRGWECENVVDLLERCQALRGLVHELPRCGDAELARYLKHARALLFPSFAEGYGMPLVEAYSLGLPVVASDLPVFKEIAGDTPDCLSPLDGAGWTQAVLDYTQPASPRRELQMNRMRRFQTPTWDGHFAAVRTLLDRLT